ncbi:hypothetical protein BU26DRAFT_561218 [Trematosphaeria pertusa]|uniref:Uncharacterized protein n=1 Tax=Trematosphaeria pertusa TaxID=390896 RepID=A0A6A6IU63_9PLEO|nr:uncharacterized protein BU26DRAFT_561218 [Trematosphaeria pertusa]KAF2253956.1 hypothetical protein BU26DRAFT_561218 [Trematosphaeria pertusa]
MSTGASGRVSAQRQRQTLSHNDDATFRSYITPTIGIDTRNVVRNLPEDRELVDSTRGVAFTRDTGAPKPHISSLYKTITPLPPDLVAAVTTKFPHSTPKFIASKARKLDFERRKEEYHASKAEQVASAAGDDASSAELPTSSIQSTPSPFFNRMLKYNHLQATAIDRLWSEEPTSILQLAMEMGETVEGDSKKPWKTWKPNSDNPAEKPWLIWNSGAPGEAAGLRDERPHNAASFSFALKESQG